MQAKTISMTSTQPDVHDLIVHFMDGNNILVELTPDQLLLLAFLAMQQIWAQYDLVPRG